MKTKRDFKSYEEYITWKKNELRHTFPIQDRDKNLMKLQESRARIRKDRVSSERRAKIYEFRISNEKSNIEYLSSLGVSSNTINKLKDAGMLSDFKWQDMPMELKVSIAKTILDDDNSGTKGKLDLANQAGIGSKAIYKAVQGAKDLSVGVSIGEDILELLRLSIPSVQYGRITITSHDNPRRNLYLWDKDNNRILHTRLT